MKKALNCPNPQCRKSVNTISLLSSCYAYCSNCAYCGPLAHDRDDAVDLHNTIVRLTLKGAAKSKAKKR